MDYSDDGNMYEKIKKLVATHNIKLEEWVPLPYIEMVYNATIQLIMAVEFAHSHGLIHGQLDLSRLWITKRPPLRSGNFLRQKEETKKSENMLYEDLEFELADFAPMHAKSLPLKPEAGVWPFKKSKDPNSLTKEEKLEVLKLRDIYAIGVCVLEMMLGRHSKLTTNIDIDKIPTEWGNLPESSTLIHVLTDCI
jgi:serine/threonine protein kinase